VHNKKPIIECLKDVHDAMVLLQQAAMSTFTIPMSTPLSANALQDPTFPPYKATFKETVIMKQILDIVYSTTGPFMVNIYPYFDKLQNSQIELDCALGVKCPIINNHQYASQFEIDVLASRNATTNLYKAQVGKADYFSTKDNFYVTETGWPSCGTSGSNANLITYNTNAIRDVETNGALEDIVGKVFLFEAHDEKNKKPEPCNNCQGCFGLMYENGTIKT